MSTETYWVKKHPTPDTLTVRRVNIDGEPDPENWEQMTVGEIDAWEASERADGWIPQAVEPPVPIPIVTRRQLFLWLLEHKSVTRAQLRDMLAGNEAALIELDEAREFERGHPLVGQLGAQLNMTSEEIDAAFRAAAQL